MTISGSARALAAAAALTLTTGLATLASSAPAHADPLQGAPTVGTCSTMTAKQGNARSDHSAQVPCGKAHTAEVAGVVQLPDRLHWGTASLTDLFRVVAEKCAPKVYDMLGRNFATRDSTAYDYVWFEPTKAQRRKGARWLSCSIVLRHATKLAKLPTSTVPFLPDGAIANDIHRCLTKSVLTTPCRARHLWRATGTFSVAGKYPGPKSLNRKAIRKCASRVQAGKAYRWTYRDRFTWNLSGDHVVVCYSKTRH